MLRIITLSICLAALPAAAAIWPEQFAGEKKTAVKEAPLTDAALWDEYGLNASEQAQYGKAFTATAWRLKDSTGALAAFQWLRPKDSTPSKVGTLAAETPDSLLLAHGNYMLRFEGRKPTAAELTGLLERLPQMETVPLPVLPSYLPTTGLIPNSQRYVLGPTSLEKFDPQIRPSWAAFHMGAEAQLGTYQTKAGPMELALFSYPTPQISRQQLAAFQKVPGAMAKRSGPYVAVIVSPPDPDAAEKVLAEVRYEAEITKSQHVPSQKDNAANLILNAIMLAGVLLAFCLAGGLAFGGMRVAARRWLGLGSDEAMISLHLDRK